MIKMSSPGGAEEQRRCLGAAGVPTVRFSRLPGRLSGARMSLAGAISA